MEKNYEREAFIDPVTGETKTKVTRYWSPEKEICYTLKQVEEMKKQDSSLIFNLKPIYYSDWKTLVETADSEQKIIKNDSETNMPILSDIQEPTAKEKAQQEISELKRYLSDTDYCAIKCGELGLSMATEYPEIYQKRIDARARINELEAMIES